MIEHETAYWCVNFDAGAGPMGGEDRESVLRYGLRQHLWAMQYQYHHDNHDYQEDSGQCGTITANWNAIKDIRPHDWCAAYLRPKMFYAIGEAIIPRVLTRGDSRPIHRDAIAATQRRRTHAHLDGIVEYTDAGGAFYEDFTDEWCLRNYNPECVSCQTHPDKPEIWRYPQRIDVAKWEIIVPTGVKVRGIAAAALSSYRRAAFRIKREFFQRIRDALEAQMAVAGR